MKPALFVVLILAFFTSFARADSLRYLPEGKQGLAQYLKMIERAEDSIDISFYIWDPCSVAGRIVMRAIERRRVERPNLKIRLVLDANLHEAKPRSEITATLAKRGVDVRFFNYSRGVVKNMRAHVKVIIVDGKEYVTGGRNIADDYYGLSSENNWIDREAHVSGASTAGAVNGFESLWNHHLTSPEKRRASPAEVKDSEETCLKADKKTLAVESFLRKNLDAILGKSPVVSCNNVKMAVDRPDFYEGQPDNDMNPAFLSGERLARKQASSEILKVVGGARDELRIENYSYLPTGAFLREIEDLRERKLKISVVTNNADDNDGTDEDGGFTHGPSAHFQRAHATGTQTHLNVPRGRLAASDWEMTPGKPTYVIHSKVLTTDKKNSVVSSWNIDARSMHTNLESALVVRDCGAFAKQVNEATERTFARARTVLANPQYRECRELLHRQREPSVLNDLLGWAIFDLL